MTVSTTATTVTYAGDGVTTAFATTFPFVDQTDLQVLERTIATGAEATKVLGTHYTVAGGAGSTGTVTALSAPASSVTWTIRRKTAQLQQQQYVSNDPFPAAAVERALDRLTMMVQEMGTDLARCLKVAKTDSTASTEFPASAARANLFAAFDGSGNPIAASAATPGALTVSAFIQTLLDDANAATARGTLGLGVHGVDGGNLASAATLTLPSDGSDYYNVTGTTTIAGLSARAAGAVVRLKFASTPTLTHSATLVLKPAASRAVAAGDVLVFVSEGGGTWRESASSGQAVPNDVAGGRLTLASGVAVMGQTNYTARTTIYYTPYTGATIALYDGSVWNTKRFTELSLALTGLAANTNFDVFLYDNSGTLTLEAVAWASDTARATAIARQDGVLVKSGSATKRLVGTFRTTATIGQTEWTPDARPSNLFVCNADNRIPVSSQVKDTTNSWTYAAATWRSANNSTSNRVSWVQSLDGVGMRARYDALAQNSAVKAAVGVGLDSTSAFTGATGYTGITSDQNQISGEAAGAPAAGLRYAQALEYATGATATFYGDNGNVYQQSGLTFNGEL